MLIERNTAAREDGAEDPGGDLRGARRVLRPPRADRRAHPGRAAAEAAVAVEQRLFQARKHVVIWDGTPELAAASRLCQRAGIILVAPVTPRDEGALHVADVVYDADQISADTCGDAILELLAR